MKPKGKLFALLAIFAAIALVTATGAFTSVSATRTAEVQIEGDGAALLAIAPNSSSPNEAYSRLNSNGEFELVLNSSTTLAGGGTGLNQDAVTQVDHVFNITNQGTQTVDLSISISSNNINIGSTANPPKFYLYAGSDETNDLTTGSVSVGTGVTQSVGMYIDTSGLDQSDDLDLTITIEATAP